METPQNNISLHPDHLLDLRKSGLSDETIRAASIYSVRPADINKNLSPFFSGKVSSVLAFPYSNHNGYQRYKLFPEVQTDKGTVRYFQPPKTGNCLYIPPGVEAILGDVTNPLYMTEGEKKCLKAWQDGLPCIGIGGLWNWSDGSEEKTLISDFEKIVLKGRTVYLVPDNDWKKPNSHGEPRNLVQAVQELADRLIDRGAKVFLVELPPGPEKGLDDFLVSYSLEEFKKLPVREIQRESPKEKKSSLEVGINLTDLGNARRFVLAHGGDLRFCYPWNKWLVWDGQIWKQDDTGEIYRRAKDTIRLIYQEAGGSNDEDRRKKLGSHALRSESDGKIKAMLSLAQSEPEIPILPDDMDKDPWVLNVANGTIDLKTGELKPHKKEDIITKLAPVEYNFGAACPLWFEHLNKIFLENPGLISFLRLAFGYSLTGITDERCLFIGHGSGANGKTTTHEVFAKTLGDYAVRTPTESILVKREGGIPNDLAKLKGARFVYCSEVEEGKRLAESLIKDLTGNDTISARFMRGEWFSFQPAFKLWLATNHKPIIRGTDNAIWSRIRLIPFNVSIPEYDRIPRSRMMERLTPELPGILAWGVQGCLDWMKFGLGMPDEVRDATENYRGEMDILGGFIDECCLLVKNATGTAKELYGAYLGWAEENGEKPVSQKMFGLRLTERGFTRKRTTGGRYQWTGIGLENVLPLK